MERLQRVGIRFAIQLPKMPTKEAERQIHRRQSFAEDLGNPLGVDLLSVIITFKPLWILMRKPIRRFASQVQNGSVG
jgi:hypothetical protein